MIEEGMQKVIIVLMEFMIVSHSQKVHDIENQVKKQSGSHLIEIPIL